MSEDVFTIYVLKLRQQWFEDAARLLPPPYTGPSAMFSGLDAAVSLPRPSYDNIGAQLGKAVDELVEDAVSELEQGVDLLREYEVGEVIGVMPLVCRGRGKPIT